MMFMKYNVLIFESSSPQEAGVPDLFAGLDRGIGVFDEDDFEEEEILVPK